jgi:C-terminal, D2-small domain, of ClpB protein
MLAHVLGVSTNNSQRHFLPARVPEGLRRSSEPVLQQQLNGAELVRHGKTLSVEPRALDKIVDQGYSPAYGARFLKRVIDDAVKLPISQRWKDVIHFRATVKDDGVVVKPTDPWWTAAAEQDAIAV